MSMFTEDPTLPVGALLLAALACFVALRLRQEGKYLIWGLSLLGLSGVVLAFEWFWVTDGERIEAVVYDMRAALLDSDADRILAHLSPDAQFVQGGQPIPTVGTRLMIQANLKNSKFDVVRIRALQISAGKRTRRGRAEFRAFVRGSAQGPFGVNGTGGADTGWSLGFVEVEPKVWKVNRITPTAVPFNPALLADSVNQIGNPQGALNEVGASDSDGWNPLRFRHDRKSIARQQRRLGAP